MQEFSDWLNSAERIIFYGYSLGDTDRQYFEKFFRKLCSGDRIYTELVFYYYGQSSYDNLIWQLQMLTNHQLTQLQILNKIEFIDCLKWETNKAVSSRTIMAQTFDGPSTL